MTKKDEFEDITNYLLKNKNKENIEALMDINQDLVNNLVSCYKNKFKNITVISEEDLYSEANLELYETILNYDETKTKYKFSTCLYYGILKRLRKLYLENRGVCKLTDTVLDKIKVINGFKKIYMFENGKEPTNEIICKELNIKKEEYNKIQALANQPLSLNEDVYKEYEPEEILELQDTISSGNLDVQEIIENKDFPIQVKKIIEESNLTETEKEVIKDAYGLFGSKKLVYRVIGEKYGISYEGARQKINAIIELLKDMPSILNYGDLIDVDTKNRKDLGRQKKKRNIKYNLFELLNEYTYDEIITAVYKLPDEYKNIIYKRYGPKLVSRISLDILTQEEQENLKEIEFGLLKKFLNNPFYIYEKENIKLKDMLKEYSIEEIKTAILDLPLDQQDALYIRYGETLEEINPVSKQLEDFISKKIVIKLKSILERNRKEEKNNYYEKLTNKGNVDFKIFDEIIHQSTFQIYLECIEDNMNLLINAILKDELDENIKKLYGEKVINDAMKNLLFGYYKFLQRYNKRLSSVTYEQKEYYRRRVEKVFIKALKEDR